MDGTPIRTEATRVALIKSLARDFFHSVDAVVKQLIDELNANLSLYAFFTFAENVTDYDGLNVEMEVGQIRTNSFVLM